MPACISQEIRHGCLERQMQCAITSGKCAPQCNFKCHLLRGYVIENAQAPSWMRPNLLNISVPAGPSTMNIKRRCHPQTSLYVLGPHGRGPCRHSLETIGELLKGLQVNFFHLATNWQIGEAKGLGGALGNCAPAGKRAPKVLSLVVAPKGMSSFKHAVPTSVWLCSTRVPCFQGFSGSCPRFPLAAKRPAAPKPGDPFRGPAAYSAAAAAAAAPASGVHRLLPGVTWPWASDMMNLRTAYCIMD